jgi:hypothetical protein
LSLKHVHRVPSQCVSDFRRSQRLLFANLGLFLFLLQNSREAGPLPPTVLRRPDGSDPVRLLDLALMVLVHLASARPRFSRRRVDPLTPGSSLEHPERGQPLRFEQWPRELVHNVPDSARACVAEVSTHGSGWPFCASWARARQDSLRAIGCRVVLLDILRPLPRAVSFSGLVDCWIEACRPHLDFPPKSI